MRKSIGLLASVVTLTSCGGDGGSNTAPVVVVGGSPSPTPSPTATPSPTPSSAVSLSTGEVKPATDAIYIAASMDLMTTGGVSQTNGIITGGMTSNRVTTFDTPGFAASYNRGYRLADTVNAAIFGQGQLSIDTTRPNGNGVVLFTRAETAEDYLALYQQTTYSSGVKASGYTAARYGGTAGWQHTVVSGSTRQTRLDYFAYGTPTPVGAMPHAGTATYSMLTSGNYATDTDLWFLTSSNGNTISVDFSTGVVSESLSLSGQNFYKSVSGGIGSFPVNGKFTGNSMTVSFANGSIGPSGRVPGQFHLVFVGPNATEVIITYVANDGTQAAVGAAVGVRDPNFN